MKLISVMTPCYNEEGNVEELYNRIKAVFDGYKGKYAYEHIFIDNASTDRTVEILRRLAAADKNVKVIVNSRNFGHIRSPHHAILQARGDAVIALASDLQDPPELITKFVEKWEQGFKIVLGVKTKSEETRAMFAVRKFYYNLLGMISETQLIKNFTGFGLYDRQIMDVLRTIPDPYPYFRGLICEIGFEKTTVEYTQPLRKRGITKNNFLTLYDMAMLGITNHSKLPLRLATLLGFGMGTLSFLFAVAYFLYKLIFWDSFAVGIAPLVIGMFFFASIQLFFLGIVGEYVGSIHTQVLRRPLVVEKERINFDEPER